MRTMHPMMKVTAETVPIPPVTYTAQQCISLDNKQIGWTATAAAFGVLSGGSGLTTAFFSDSTPRYITGSISVLMAVGIVVSGYLSKAYGKEYADNCTVNVGGR